MYAVNWRHTVRVGQIWPAASGSIFKTSVTVYYTDLTAGKYHVYLHTRKDPRCYGYIINYAVVLPLELQEIFIKVQ